MKSAGGGEARGDAGAYTWLVRDKNLHAIRDGLSEAYRDLEQASGRLALAERLAALLAATPAELLPVVCYLCQGLIAPEFAGVDLGLAAAEYKYDGVRVQAHRTADGAIELFTRRLERVSAQFPDVVTSLAAGLGPREAILEGEVVAYDAAAGELHPFGEVMFRGREHGID